MIKVFIRRFRIILDRKIRLIKIKKIIPYLNISYDSKRQLLIT